MHETLPFLFVIVILILLLNMLAKKISVAYPILIVIAGLLISLIPSAPKLKLDPDWVFFIILPPLLYEAAWSISFKGLKKWYRMIGSFSFLVVFFTATVVAIFANHFIPGFSLALGFLLGGIVSPPDAVSAGAIMRFVKIPKTTSTILEGESLFNDASSLIIFRFAMIAVGTGQFIWSDAITSFGWMIFGGVAVGLAIGWIFKLAHKYLPTDAPTDIVFTLLQPFILYWIAEQIGSSGVMAVVTGGLYLSSQRYRVLNSQSRIRGYSFWQSFVFILNGLVFFVIGFDLSEVVGGLENAGISVQEGVFWGFIITALIIFIRIVSSYLAMLSTLIFRRSIVSANFSFKRAWKIILVLGWTGMRGVVTLAAACSIPLYLDDGTAFPQRELILFISFMVIILTLFIQGLTLPTILRRVDLNQSIVLLESENEEETTRRIRKELWQFSIDQIQKNHSHSLEKDIQLAATLAKWQQKLNATEEETFNPETRRIYLELLDAQRNFLIERNKDTDVSEEIIRHEIGLIDFEEEKMKML